MELLKKRIQEEGKILPGNIVKHLIGIGFIPAAVIVFVNHPL